MVSADKTWFEFGDFRLNAEKKILRRNGEIVPLPSRVVEVLCVLVERRGGVVSKEELMETVWADSFVEESNITQSIYSLRRALGTDNRGKTFIETVPKRGYRLAASVSTDTDRRSISQDLPAAEPTVQVGKPTSSRRNLVLVTIGILLILSVSGFYASSYFWKRPAPPIESVKFQRLTFSGDISFPIISPDGKSFAYLKDGAINLQDIATGSSFKLNIPDHKAFGNLQFSNEGESIFFRNEDSYDAAGDVYKVSRFGGTAKLIADHVWSTVGQSTDSQSLAFVRFYPNEGEWALILKDLTTGTERKLLSRNLPYTIYRRGFPAWSPDGTRIAIVEQTPEALSISKLLLVNARTGESEILKTSFVQIEQVAWLPESKGLLITGRENNRFFQLWKMALPSGDLHPVTNDLNIYRSLSVSSDGKYMLARGFTVYSHIWLAQSDDLQNPRQITFGNLSRDGYSGLSYSPDGNIIYSARITGDTDLWSIRPSDGTRKRLTENVAPNNSNPFVTADGRYIFFESTRGGRRHIWRSDIDGSNPTQITFADNETDFFPVVARSGETLYYTQRNPKANVVWRQSLIDGTREMLTQQGKFSPGNFLSLSPDERFLAFENFKDNANNNTSEIAMIDLVNGGEPRIVTIQSPNAPIEWTPNSLFFDYVEGHSAGAKVWRQSMERPDERKLLFQLQKDHIFAFAWSRDGKSLALSCGRQESDAILLTGF